MTFTVPASKASLKQNRFEFTFASSPRKKHSVPKMQYLAPRFARRLKALMAEVTDPENMTREQALAIDDLAVEVFDHYVPGFLDLCEDDEQVQAIIGAWSDASSVSLGESSASSVS